MPALAVTEITAACNRDHNPQDSGTRSILLSGESGTDAGFLSRFTGHVRDRF
jgi:hypothetical protein